MDLLLFSRGSMALRPRMGDDADHRLVGPLALIQVVKIFGLAVIIVNALLIQVGDALVHPLFHAKIEDVPEQTSRDEWPLFDLLEV